MEIDDMIDFIHAMHAYEPKVIVQMFRWMPWDLHEELRHAPELVGEFSEAELRSIKAGSQLNSQKKESLVDEIEIEEEEEPKKPRRKPGRGKGKGKKGKGRKHHGKRPNGKRPNGKKPNGKRPHNKKPNGKPEEMPRKPNDKKHPKPDKKHPRPDKKRPHRGPGPKKVPEFNKPTKKP